MHVAGSLWTTVTIDVKCHVSVHGPPIALFLGFLLRLFAF